MAKGSFERFLRPSDWPIAGKLALAFVLASLVPIFLTAVYGSRETIATVSRSQEQTLQEFAQNTANRLDQLIRSTSRSVKLLRRLDGIEIAANRRTPSSLALANEIAADFVAANDELELVLLMNPTGRVLAASSPLYLGADFSSRRHFKLALQSRDYASSLEVGRISGNPGVYFSAAIRDAKGRITGVIALKLADAAVRAVIQESPLLEGFESFLIDEHGVIISHRDPKKRFKSLVPLAPQVMEEIKEDQRYATDAIESIDRSALAGIVLGAKSASSWRFRDADGAERFVAVSPVLASGWTYGVVGNTQVWAEPLKSAFADALSKALVVALVAALVALAFFHRDIVKPVRALTKSARAVRRGELRMAEAAVVNDDEIGYLARAFNGMVVSIAARERERDIFGRVVTPEVRERLLSGQLKLGGENRNVSVLFSDIRDFTSLCEGQPPEAVVELINAYLTEMTAAIKPHKGYVNNFLGDAIIVVFGAPQDHDDPAHSAILAAFDMRARLAAFNAQRSAEGKSELRSGIGIASGVVVAGQMGSLDRFMYTVIGDAVNVAARLETLTKEFPDNPVLINDATAERVRHLPDVRLTYVGAHQLKGRAAVVDIYSASPPSPPQL